MALSTADLKRSIVERDAEISSLRAALYDATEGISATLHHDENERISQEAANALALVDWWFTPEERCPKCIGPHTFARDFMMAKRTEMLAAVRDALTTLKGRGVTPRDPNPF